MLSHRRQPRPSPRRSVAVEVDEAAAVLAALSLQSASEPQAGGWVRVVGLTARAELNGALARLGAWDEARQRWPAHFEDAPRLLRTQNLHALRDDEPDAIAAEAAAQMERLVTDIVAETAAQAMEAAEAARREREAAVEVARLEREAAAEAAERALASYIGGLPISPAGYFNSRERLLEWHEYGEPPPDQGSSTEQWRVASERAAWDDETAAFCCVGAPHFCADGHLPHNVIASPAQPQRALAHLVQWEHTTVHHTRVDFSVARQCESCAHMLLEKRCPLSIVPVAVFRAECRARCEEAAIPRCDACEPMPQPAHTADTPAACMAGPDNGVTGRATQRFDPAQSGTVPTVTWQSDTRLGSGNVYRRGRILLWIPYPGSREMLINPRERPCELCHAGPAKAHATTCPCVNVESVPERHV